MIYIDLDNDLDVIEDKRNEFLNMLKEGDPKATRQLRRYIRRKSWEWTSWGGTELKHKRGYLIVLPYEYEENKHHEDQNLSVPTKIEHKRKSRNSTRQPPKDIQIK